MKKYLNTLFLLVCIVFSLSIHSYAQVVGSNTGEQNLELIGSSTEDVAVVRTVDNRYEGVEGTPYLFDDWMSGVLFKGGKEGGKERKIGHKGLNYDLINDELVYKDPKGPEYVLSKSDYPEFHIDAANGKSKKFINSEAFGFLEEIYDDNGNKLLAKRMKKFIPANFDGPYNANRRTDRIIEKPANYFFKTAQGEIIPLGNKKKMIKKALKDNPSIKNSLMQNKTWLSKEPTLASLV